MGLAFFSLTAKTVAHRCTWRALVVALALSTFPSARITAGASDQDAAAAAGLVPGITAQIDAGQFAAAESRIAQALGGSGLAQSVRNDLEFQHERMRRIRLDFTLAEEDVKAKVRRKIPDLTDAEFAGWNTAGLFEHAVIDGRVFLLPACAFQSVSPQRPGARATQGAGTFQRQSAADHQCASPRGARRGARRTSHGVAPRRLRVTQTLTVHADAVPAGKTVRAWIPYPRAIAGQQVDLHFVASAPANALIAPETTLQRTAFMQKKAEAGVATKFSLTYELTVFAQYHAVDAAKVVPVKPTPELAPFLDERPPHIVFTEGMRLFSRQIVGDEKNPWRIAQKLFAAVDQVPWAGAREYSTITDISEYALHAGHADCGQQTLLLMTLLRLNGIPTRWQSGMIFSDGSYNDLHDWGWLYIAPYGWMPMDVTFGRLDSDDPAIAGFYLGGIDAYRIAFNDDYGRDLVPAKKFFRSETVDLQRGEAEWDGGNLYFDVWDYDFSWEMLQAKSSHGQ